MAGFKKAERSVVKNKTLITGPSGSGKTLGALRLAESLFPGGRIALLDSENDRSGYYADAVDFDVLSLKDCEPATYVLGLNAAVAEGYDVVIIDSLSHAWSNVLDRKGIYDRKKTSGKANPYTSWAIFGGEWEAFVREILDAPIHVLATARSKQAYEQTDKAGGGTKVEKIGLAPQIREGTEYEFAFHFDINAQHTVDVKKDNSRLLGDPTKNWDLCDGSIATVLRGWMATATPVARPTPETCARIDTAIGKLPEARQASARRRWAQRRDKGVTDAEALEMIAALGGKVAPPAPPPATPQEGLALDQQLVAKDG